MGLGYQFSASQSTRQTINAPGGWVIMGGSGAFGNAATRIEAMAVKGGTYAYGSYPDLDEMFKQQGAELDQKKRGAILEKLQQIVNERTMFAPIWQLAFINGHGPRV